MQKPVRSGVKFLTQSAHHTGSWDWDCAVALEYAAEQLLKVSELPRGVIVPSAEALNISYLKCISCLLQHEDLLPKQSPMQLSGIAVASNTAGCRKSVGYCEVEGRGLADTLELQSCSILLRFRTARSLHLGFGRKEAAL